MVSDIIRSFDNLKVLRVFGVGSSAERCGKVASGAVKSVEKGLFAEISRFLTVGA